MPDRLTAMDASFLYLEKPAVHMHVAGVAILDQTSRPQGRLTIDDIRELILKRIHLVPRFRQKVAFLPYNLGRPMWVDDDRFDIDFHLRRTALPEPGGRTELNEFVQRVTSRQLDRSKPLWEMYLIEGLEGGQVAVLWKSHHAMIDGMSGVDIATVLFDFTPEPREVEPEPWVPHATPMSELMRHWVVDSVTHPVEAAAVRVQGAMRAPRDAAAQLRQVLGGIGSLAGSWQAPRSPFNVSIGPNRRFATAEAPVDDAKAIKNALGGTVNDVILAVVAGSLRRLLIERGEEPSEGERLRAMVPISTRDVSQRMALGNRISMFFVDLPTGPMDAADRLRQITAATRDLKESKQAVGAASIMGVGRWAPPTLHALTSRVVARQRFANVIVSNVPGPQIPLYMAGARMVVTFPVMPLAETMALSVAITSLSGIMGFGFTGDWDAMPDIELLADGVLASVEELKKSAGV